jgi:hypothetical protein
MPFSARTRWLGELGELEAIFRAVEAEIGDGEAERVVGLFEGAARDVEIVEELPAHADGLRALSGKEEAELAGSHARGYFN